MKNTQANKERFFALYWGQRVGSDKKLRFVCAHNISALSMLRLMPLSSITDEDAASVSKLYSDGQALNADLHSERGKRILRQVVGLPKAGCVDYLRGNGYALPWTTPQGETITVEEQIEFGWLKLKNK